MKPARRVAWGMWIGSVLFIVAFLLLVVFQQEGGVLEYGIDPITALYAVIMTSLATIGIVIASRHPRNSIGWLFCGAGLIGSAGFAAQLYADRVLFAVPGWGPAGEVAAWISSWAIPSGLFVGPMFLLFLFPDGSPGRGRRRTLFGVIVALFILTMTIMLFWPGPLEPFPSVQNPFGIPGEVGQWLREAEGVFMAAPLLVFLIGVGFLVTRFRLSRGVVRQQMKWFTYPAALMGVFFAVSFGFSAAEMELPSDAFFLAGALMLFAIPVTSMIAILRYRLYDIDVVINRTLVYGLLTAILGTSYLALVALMQLVLQPLTPESDLSIVVSTLAVAALFRPARARIQGFIDRRFYRSRYDAAATLDGFSTRLRDQVDLDSLRAEIVEVVGTTVQPAHASLWLRPREEAR